MEKIEKTTIKTEEPVALPNHAGRIKSQVLAKIGKPSRLDRVEVSRHHNGKYRVNIWEQPEPNKNIAVHDWFPNSVVLLFDGVGHG